MCKQCELKEANTKMIQETLDRYFEYKNPFCFIDRTTTEIYLDFVQQHGMLVSRLELKKAICERFGMKVIPAKVNDTTKRVFRK
jgi:hypothetical protein